MPAGKGKSKDTDHQLGHLIGDTDAFVGDEKKTGGDDAGNGWRQQFFDMRPVRFTPIQQYADQVHGA